MPSASVSIPRLCHHKASGQAVVRLNGKDHYLGRYRSPEAEQAYKRLIALWISNGERLPEDNAHLSVNEVILQYWRHCDRHYRKPNGVPTSEMGLTKLALRCLRELFGNTDAGAFGPSSLKAVRTSMIHQGLCRNTINKHIGRIRQMFRWAVENEIVGPSVYHGLLAVRGLQKGRSEAKESAPVRPVPENQIEAARALVKAPVQAMIDLQLMTAMRPGEVTILRACDLDMTGPVWIYRPSTHKTEHHQHQREIYLGPKAQAIVRPFLNGSPDAYLFSPADARAEQYRSMRNARASKVQPSQLCRKKQNPKRKPGAAYTVASYRRCIRYACDKAFPLPARLAAQPGETHTAWQARLTSAERLEIQKWRSDHAWHPHQLRHNAATNIRREFGIEIARIILGHAHINTTELYAEENRCQAMAAIVRVG